MVIPHLSFSTIIPEHKVKSSLSISPYHNHELTRSTAYTESSIHRVQHTPSTPYTEYSIHRVQHTPSTAYTEYSIYWVQHKPQIVCYRFIFTIMSWPLNQASASRRASLQDRPPPASSPWTLKGKVTSLHPPGCELTKWWIECQHLLSLLSTASKYSNLGRSWPPNVSLNSLNHGLQVHLQTLSITTSKCISEFTWTWPPSASPNSLNRGLQVHL